MMPAQATPDFFQQAYLGGENPRAQSGFCGDERGWELARRPIVSAIDREGSFLDIGCANGYLLESVVRWATHQLEPYGLDFAPKLVELARRRLPHWADRIFLGEAFSWEPPRRFDFVRTELCYVKSPCERELVRRLIDRVVAPAGRLIICRYRSPRSGLTTEPVGAQLRSWAYEPELELTQQGPEGRGPVLELAALRAPK